MVGKLMQKFSDFSKNDHLNVGIPKMYDDIVTALSNSSGNAFPTANLQVGMTCYRTDLQKEYRLIKLVNNTPTWQICDDAKISVGSTVFDSKGNQIDSYYLPKSSTLFVTGGGSDVQMRNNATTAKNLCSRSDGLDNLGRSGKAWNNVYAKSIHANTISADTFTFSNGTQITANTYISKSDIQNTYLTKSDASNTYATKSTIPTRTSQLTNDSNYVYFSDGKALEIGNYLDLHSGNDMTPDYTFRVLGDGTLQIQTGQYIKILSNGHLSINGSEVWVE